MKTIESKQIVLEWNFPQQYKKRTQISFIFSLSNTNFLLSKQKYFNCPASCNSGQFFEGENDGKSAVVVFSSSLKSKNSGFFM